MKDFYDSLLEAMAEQKIFIDGKIDTGLTGKFQRFRASACGKRKKDVFVVIHGLEDGASFGHWKYGEDWTTWWYRSFNSLSLREKELRRQEMEMQKHHQELLYRHAAHRCQMMWQHPLTRQASFDHPYIKLKRIVPYYAKQLRNRLLLPIQDIARNIQSLQFILPPDWKKFKLNGRFSGGFMHLGEEVRPGDVIRICEGYATGCSIYEAIGQHVIVAFNAGNMSKVAAAIKMKYAQNEIHICADADEAGIREGQKAATSAGAYLFVPDFSGLEPSAKDNDYNDLMCLAGIEEVERQLLTFDVRRNFHGKRG